VFGQLGTRVLSCARQVSSAEDYAGSLDSGRATDPSGEFGLNATKRRHSAAQSTVLRFQRDKCNSESNVEPRSDTTSLKTTYYVTTYLAHGKHLTKFGVQVVATSRNFFYPATMGRWRICVRQPITANPNVAHAGGYGFAEVFWIRTWSAIGGVSVPLTAPISAMRIMSRRTGSSQNLPSTCVRLWIYQPIYEVKQQGRQRRHFQSRCMHGTPNPCRDCRSKRQQPRPLQSFYGELCRRLVFLAAITKARSAWRIRNNRLFEHSDAKD